MELYHLRTFVTVAEEGNLTRASERLHLSQPAVSAHVKSLEEELGVGLFTRTSKGMELTDSGRRLTVTARDALRRAQEMLEQAKALRGGVSGAVVLTRNTDASYLRLPEILAELGREHPEALVHVDCRDSYEVPQALKDGRMHAGFAYGCFGADPQLTALPVAMATVRVVGPASWKDMLDKATVRDLASLPWVWFHERCPFVAMAQNLLAEEGQVVKTAAVINDEHTIRALVASGKGLSLLREDLAARSPLGEELAVWPGGGLGLPVNLVALTRRLGEPEVKALMAAAATVFGVEEATAAA
jgi:DNA-binding transcriptional LysR family regulator